MNIFKWLSATRPGREGYVYQPSNMGWFFERVVAYSVGVPVIIILIFGLVSFFYFLYSAISGG